MLQLFRFQSHGDIEPKKNSYTDAYVKAFIDYCVKYKNEA